MRYKPNGVCSREISFDIVNNTLKNVKISGGCPGNSQGLARLAEGMNIDDVIARLDGIHCGMRSTSCPDQLAKALKEYKRNE